jgi:adenylate kinase family enzyme
MHALDELGERICIMGPSSSGKSTLATAIARRRGLPAVHLDQLYHQPRTDWQPRPTAEFLRLHEQAIRQPRWVMEGNYTRCLDQRLERATGFILLDVATAIGLWRYVRRTWFDGHRYGALEGNRDSVKWSMVRHIAIATPPKRRAWLEVFEDVDRPKVRLSTTRALNGFYDAEGLEREVPGRAAR